MCIECLDKQKESKKVYNQKEVFCDICQRNHSNKEKLKKDEGKKQKEMEEY